MRYGELPEEVRIVCNIGIMMWAMTNVYLFLRLFFQKISVLQKWLLLVYCIVSIALFQGVSDAAKNFPCEQDYSLLAYGVRSLSVRPLVVLVAVFVGSEILYVLHLQRRLRSHLSPDCVKESMDALPDGIAFAKKSGTTILVNAKMQYLSSHLTGGRIMNLHQFWENLLIHSQRISEEGLDSDSLIVKDENGKIWNFSRRQCECEGEAVVEVTASDVTSLHQLRQKLKDRNDKLLDVNKRLKRFAQDVEQVTREQELLDAKVKMHDNLGKMLLAYRSYEERSAEEGDRYKVLELWKQTIAILEQEGAFRKETDWNTLLRTAQQLRVDIRLTGRLPQDSNFYPLFVMAVRECLTNIVKHAHGTILYVCVARHETMHRLSGDRGSELRTLRITIWNNGIKPENEVTEGGGLTNLRRQIEDAGGILRIDSTPRFQMTIWLPEYKEERENENQGNDC